jgi:hypothetical protein
LDILLQLAANSGNVHCLDGASIAISMASGALGVGAGSLVARAGLSLLRTVLVNASVGGMLGGASQATLNVARGSDWRHGIGTSTIGGIILGGVFSAAGAGVSSLLFRSLRTSPPAGPLSVSGAAIDQPARQASTALGSGLGSGVSGSQGFTGVLPRSWIWPLIEQQ